MLNKTSLHMPATSIFAFGLIVLFSGSEHMNRTIESGISQKQIPAYHDHAPNTALPDTLSPGQFKDASARACYQKASSIKSAIYQMPCYCHCDRHFGHKSLLDCFVTDHGSICDTCQRELLYVSQQLKKGTSISQIRKGIIDQKWSSIDLDNPANK